MALRQIFLLIFLNNLMHVYSKINKLSHAHAFDLDLYEDVLDSAMCIKQMNYLLYNDTLQLLEFLDAGSKIPRGFMRGNLFDYGNYYQCLNIHNELSDSTIEGKYCTIEVPLDQPYLELPDYKLFDILDWLNIPMPSLNLQSSRFNSYQLKQFSQYKLGNHFKRFSPTGPLQGVSMSLAVCIPKVCTTRNVLNELPFNISSMGIEYIDRFCRLPNDKPWVMADYVAIAVFSIVGFVTLLSTAYDIRHTVLLGKDPKHADKIYQSFSVYTNTRRLVTYTPVPGALECLDGIRAMAIMWVIIGHTVFIQLLGDLSNPADAVEWMTSFRSTWITNATITVDTFFMISGLLLVYTVAAKFTRWENLKNLHLFYLLRLLRIFPLLAVTVLLQASLVNHAGDGPNWEMVKWNVHNCRKYWWSTLLHVQNYVNPNDMCLTHGWFLAIEVQLHILSPLVLFWILGRRRRTAFLALTIAVLFALVPATVYNFIMEFPGSTYVPSRLNQQAYYFQNYYINTLTRCSPYVVGMVYGYLLHMYRDKKAVIPKTLVILLWPCTMVMLNGLLNTAYPTVQPDWDNQTVESLINSLVRPAWALALGWVVFACVQGYGGPVSWVLSLPMWKVLSRISYAMYLVHYPLIMLVNSSKVTPAFFTEQTHIYEALSNLFATVMVAFVLTVLVDSPCSALIKHFVGGGSERPQCLVKDELPNSKSISGTTFTLRM